MLSRKSGSCAQCTCTAPSRVCTARYREHGSVRSCPVARAVASRYHVLGAHARSRHAQPTWPIVTHKEPSLSKLGCDTNFRLRPQGGQTMSRHQNRVAIPISPNRVATSKTCHDTTYKILQLSCCNTNSGSRHKHWVATP